MICSLIQAGQRRCIAVRPTKAAVKKDANLATNYFAVAHPSLTNHLEIVGGSNLGCTHRQRPGLA